MAFNALLVLVNEFALRVFDLVPYQLADGSVNRLLNVQRADFSLLLKYYWLT